MKDGYSLSRAPKARAKKIFGIVGMKMCKITYLFTILLRAVSLKNVKNEKPANALAHEKVIFGVIWDKKDINTSRVKKFFLFWGRNSTRITKKVYENRKVVKHADTRKGRYCRDLRQKLI